MTDKDLIDLLREARDPVEYAASCTMTYKKNWHKLVAEIDAVLDRSNTTVECACGDSYPANSYQAGFIVGRGKCENCAAGDGERLSQANRDLVNKAMSKADSYRTAVGLVEIKAASRKLRAHLERMAAPQPAAPAVPASLHPRTADLVQRFAAALAEKLAAAEAKYGYSDNWANTDWMDECRAELVDHVIKGDPRDVAAYCAFLWHHGESTSLPAAPAVPLTDEQIESIIRDAYSPDISHEDWCRASVHAAMLAAAPEVKP